MCETCVERRGEEQKKEKEELKKIYSFTDKQIEQILAKYPNFCTLDDGRIVEFR